MGNRFSTGVTRGVKDQAAGATKELYEYVDLSGKGKLVELMKKANKTKNYLELEMKIEEWLPQFLYNGGNGKMVHVSELVKFRGKERGLKLKDEDEAQDEYNASENGIQKETGN